MPPVKIALERKKIISQGLNLVTENYPKVFIEIEFWTKELTFLFSNVHKTTSITIESAAMKSLPLLF